MLRRAQHLERAVTLVELLIAMIITSMLALGVASILHAASYGTSSKREIRRVAVRSQQIRSQLDDSIRTARAVLACGETVEGDKYIVLWKGDSNQTDQNQVNLSELLLIEWVPGSQTLTAYDAPGAPDPDPFYAADADFYNEADQARSDGDLTGTVWSQGVSAFEMTLIDDGEGQARMVAWSLTVIDELLSESLVGTTSLRCPGAPQ